MDGRPRLAVVVKGYPRLSETFVAQELLGLEARGLDLEIWSLRHPTDRLRHAMHDAIRAPRHYLPEYLHEAPFRVLRGLIKAARQPGFRRAFRAFRRDFHRDRTRNRLRRFGQACVLATELDPAIRHLHVHFLHTPASTARYAAMMSGRSWSFSAHAKDIWTIPEWEKAEKLADARWGVTCTAEGHRHLAALAADPESVSLIYHGLDPSRFPPPEEARPIRSGYDPADPVRILAVGRAVEKKGFDDLLAALAALPGDLQWTLAHCGGGPLLDYLKAVARSAGIAHRVAFLGAKTQADILALMREADIFALPSRPAADGDRDGLPNVLMEAASQEMAIVATEFAAIPECLRSRREALLVPPGDWPMLSNGLNVLIRDPDHRRMLGQAAALRVRTSFGAGPGLDRLAARLRSEIEGGAEPAAMSPAKHGP